MNIAEEGCSTKKMKGNFKFQKDQTTYTNNSITWVGETGFIHVGPHSVFQCASGLRHLLKNRGKLKGLSIQCLARTQGGVWERRGKRARDLERNKDNGVQYTTFGIPTKSLEWHRKEGECQATKEDARMLR